MVDDRVQHSAWRRRRLIAAILGACALIVIVLLRSDRGTSRTGSGPEPEKTAMTAAPPGDVESEVEAQRPGEPAPDRDPWTARLLDAAGHPVAGGQVRLIRQRAVRTTDEQGRFRLPVPEKPHEGLVVATVEGREQSFLVKRDGQDLRMPDELPLSVMLLDGTTGAPLTGGEVRAWCRRSDDYVPLENFGPVWRLSELTSRTRGEQFSTSLRIRPPEGWLAIYGTGHPSAFLAEHARSIRHRLVLWPARNLEVRVRHLDGSPAARVSAGVILPGDLRVETPDHFGPASIDGVTDAEGHAKLSGIPAIPGECYQVLALAGSKDGVSLWLVERRLFGVAGEVDIVELVSREMFESMRDLNVQVRPNEAAARRLKRAAPAAGPAPRPTAPELVIVVLDEQNRPVPCAEIQVVWSGGAIPIVVDGVQEMTLLTDLSGRASVPGLPPEELEVRAFYGSRWATGQARPGETAVLRLSK